MNPDNGTDSALADADVARLPQVAASGRVDGLFVGPAHPESLDDLFGRAHPTVGVPYWGEVARLRRGAADVPAFRRAVQELVPDEAIAFQSEARNATKVERAVRPSVGALDAFAIVLVCNAVAAIPGRMAARIHPAVVLRSE